MLPYAYEKHYVDKLFNYSKSKSETKKLNKIFIFAKKKIKRVILFTKLFTSYFLTRQQAFLNLLFVAPVVQQVS